MKGKPLRRDNEIGATDISETEVTTKNTKHTKGMPPDGEKLLDWRTHLFVGQGVGLQANGTVSGS
jgi:hypothetical protein